MATIRSGLRVVANNSPALTQLQLSGKRPLINSDTNVPLKHSGLLSPLILAENKENYAQTNVVETVSSSTQSDVIACNETPELTDEDLNAPEATTNYWRTLCDEFDKQYEDELDRSLKLVCDLNDSLREIDEVKDKLTDLKEIEAEIIEEQAAEKAQEEEEQKATASDNQ